MLLKQKHIKKMFIDIRSNLNLNNKWVFFSPPFLLALLWGWYIKISKSDTSHGDKMKTQKKQEHSDLSFWLFSFLFFYVLCTSSAAKYGKPPPPQAPSRRTRIGRRKKTKKRTWTPDVCSVNYTKRRNKLYSIKTSDIHSLFLQFFFLSPPPTASPEIAHQHFTWIYCTIVQIAKINNRPVLYILASQLVWKEESGSYR